MQDFEPFVDADTVASFLSLTRRRVLELAREKGGVPSHPVGTGPRKTYRFRLSEVADWLQRRHV